MRITNGMMINNTLSHINLNKLNVDKYSTQQSTEKKIQKPSEDPIIAVRALRFRSQLAELNQYLEKNIPDAKSWLELSEEALGSVSSNLSEMQTYLKQAANDTNGLANRQAIIKTLAQYKEQIYKDANSDYGGRRIFSGYKTDTDMTFAYADKTVKYHLTEEFTPADFDTISKVFDGVDVSSVDLYVPGTPEADQKPMPNDKTDVHRIRLAYDDLMAEDTIDGNTITPTVTAVAEDGTRTNVAVKVVSAAADGTYQDADGNTVNPYDPEDNDVYFLTDSGEMIFGDTAYVDLKEKNLSVSYAKTGFEKGDLRPEHYFNCTRYTTNDGQGYKKDIIFDSNQQDINYTVNFNQTLKVNSEGRNLFGHDVIRDLEDIIVAIEDLGVIEEKIAKIEKMQEDEVYSGEEDQKKLASMLEAANKEKDLQDDIVQKLFEKSMTLYEKHQTNIDEEIADIGSRYKRLQLNESRLDSQQTSLEKLKSTNEDTNLPETIIKLSAASMVYDASLSAASKIVTKSLLDYLG